MEYSDGVITKIIRYYDEELWEQAIENAKRAEIYAGSWKERYCLILEIYGDREI